MTQQEIVERDVRLALGDLTLQLIVARAEAQSLREQIEAQAEPPLPGEKVKPNGKAKEAAEDGPGHRPQ